MFKIFEIIFTCSIIYLLTFSWLIIPVYAQPNPVNPNPYDPDKNPVNTINLGISLGGSNLGIQTQGKEGLVGTILKNVLVLFFAVGGIGTIVYFLWGAVDWILSGGDKEQVANARKKMTHALIGLVLLSLSFVIIRIIGQIVGFNPLETIELRSLEDK